MARIRIRWIKSDIGCSGAQKLTRKALGFHKLNEVIEKEDTPAVRGMIAKINHLLTVEESRDGSE